jgi:threonyl-tRNA synthetase
MGLVSFIYEEEYMKITFPDGNSKELQEGMTGIEIASGINEYLGRITVAVEINGNTCDMTTPIKEDCSVKFLTIKEEEGLAVLRHSTSHIMALAVKRLFPEVKLGIGPSIENGFYYDFDNLKIQNTHLETIEDEMKKIVKEKIPFERKVVSREEAMTLFADEPFKLELISELPDEEVISIYTCAEFTDLCMGPHIPHSGYAKAIKLMSIAGSYWKGSSDNTMLTRIYGTVFFDKKELKEYLEMRRIAEESDHARLGKELDLFINVKSVGQGLPLFTPRGTAMLRVLQRFIEDEETKRGYKYTLTPYLAKSELYKISGHWDHYKENMFVIGEESCDEEIALRPMTCPHQFMLYNRKIHSYKDLPIRYAETSTLFRNEGSGAMHGLIRIRQFTLAEGHIICRMDQIEEEFTNALNFVKYVMETLGLAQYVTYQFSKWDPNNLEKYINNPRAWESSERILKQILDHLGLDYKERVGEAAFYGPKLDINMKNVWGKEDTVFTLQIDFALPERFGMKYQDKNGEEKAPFIIHRSSIGCYERTLAMLIEHYKGKFPFWMAPEQIRLLAMNEDVLDFAEQLKAKLLEYGLRAEIDRRSETLNKKVRDAQIIYIPAIVTLGNKEKEGNTVSVRTLDGKVIYGLPIDDFISQCQKLDRERSLNTEFTKTTG